MSHIRYRDRMHTKPKKNSLPLQMAWKKELENSLKT